LNDMIPMKERRGKSEHVANFLRVYLLTVFSIVLRALGHGCDDHIAGWLTLFMIPLNLTR
jgi:hypothetical protein